MEMPTDKPKKKRGLGSENMNPEVKRRIQSAGGKAQPRSAKVRGGEVGGKISRRKSGGDIIEAGV